MPACKQQQRLCCVFFFRLRTGLQGSVVQTQQLLCNKAAVDKSLFPLAVWCNAMQGFLLHHNGQTRKAGQSR